MNAHVARRTLTIDSFLDAPIPDIATTLAARRTSRRSEGVTLYQRGLMLSPLAMLAACGGGGGGGGGGGTPPPPPASVTGNADVASVAVGTTTATGNVLTNDTTANTSAALTVTAVAIQGGAGGTVGTPLTGTFGSFDLESNGAFTYTLNTTDADYVRLGAGQTATETFTYTPSAGSTSGQPTTVTITVTGANDAPTAVADSGSAGENETKSFDVLANDTDPDTTPADTKTLVSIDTVTVTSANGAVNNVNASGTFSIVNGQIQFAPGTQFDALANGETATVTVNYTMRDAAGATSSSTLTLTVNGAAETSGGSSVDLGDLGSGGIVVAAPSASANFGWSIAAGDVTGDGLMDLVVGAPAIGAASAGAIYIYAGTATGLSASPQVISGISSGDRLGYSVSVGNLNQDGVADILVGAPGAGLNAGAVYGLFGGSVIANPATLNATTGFQFTGADGGQAFTSNVTQIGVGLPGTGDLGTNFGASVEIGQADINGDGRDDFFISSPGINGGAPSFAQDTGLGYIVYGQTSYTSGGAGTLLGGGNGFGAQSKIAVDSYGYSSAWAGDINGDGVDDLLLADPRRDTDNNGSASGAVLIRPAPYTPAGSVTDFPELTDVLVYTNVADASFGASITEANLNGDAFDDLIIAAPGANKIYIVFGQASYSAGEINVDNPASIAAAGARVVEISGSGSFGASISTAGDFNGDGLEDVVIGAPGDDAAYVLLGRSTIDSSTYDVASGRGLIKLTGGADNTGAQVIGGADANGDGFDDVVISAPSASGTGTGTVYIVYGFSTSGGAAAERTPVAMADLLDDGSNSLDGLIGAAGSGDGQTALATVHEPIDWLGTVDPYQHLV